jgi:hypothetical protein
MKKPVTKEKEQLNTNKKGNVAISSASAELYLFTEPCIPSRHPRNKW